MYDNIGLIVIKLYIEQHTHTHALLNKLLSKSGLSNEVVISAFVEETRKKLCESLRVKR